jgi:hypothetical protein
MGYEGPSLAHTFDFEESIRRVGDDIADEAGTRMMRDVREFTPVGHQPHDSGYIPGHLKESISKKLVVVSASITGLVWETGADTNVDYAVFVENGTGLWGPHRAKYEIVPKNPNGWLRFVASDGRVIFAKRVMHPGSPGAHMFARGVVKFEAEFHTWANDTIRRWGLDQDVEIRLRSREVRIAS